MENYKEGIVASRTGSLGSSDASMMQNIYKLGYVPASAYERLAIVKGLVEPKDSFKTKEMEFGDYIEQQIFANISECDKRYISNPLWISSEFSRKNVKLICHPDIVLYDERTKTIYVYEVKTTKFNVKRTKETYRPQMYVEWLLANEQTKSGEFKKWSVKLFLAHYDTNGIEDLSGHEFTPQRFSLHRMAFSRLFDVNRTMDIIDAFLDDFNEYYKGDEVNSEYLPENVREEFVVITNALNEIKEREAQVNEFKEKLYKFMLEKGIKSIKNDEWNITRIDESESVSFNSKAFIEDLTARHPRKAKKILKEFEKRTKRKGYVSIKLK